MSGFTQNLSNLPPGCTDTEIERAQVGDRELAPAPCYTPMRFPEEFRWKDGPAPIFRSNTGDDFGWFLVPPYRAPKNIALAIMATAGDTDAGPMGEWEHVSVSLQHSRNKTASWEAMCFVKSLFWHPSACVVQFHPPGENYVNQHPGCLHLWRCKTQEFPMPPVVSV